MKCAVCASDVPVSALQCARCGAPAILGRMAEVEVRAEALRAAYQAGALSEPTYNTEFARLAFSDPGYGSWSPGAHRGEWLWWDGSAWVHRAPPSVSANGGTPFARRWPVPPLWMALGCGLVGGVGFLAAIVLTIVLVAPRDLELTTLPSDSPSAAIEDNLSQPVPLPTVNVTPTSIPLLIRPYDALTDADLVNLASVATGSWDTANPGRFAYQARFPAGQPAVISFAWCAKDPAALEANWSDFAFEFSLDGEPIDLGTLALLERKDDSGACRSFAGVVENLELGHHSFVRTHHLLAPVNDGYDTYPQGDYVYAIEFEVGGFFALRSTFDSGSTPWPAGEAGIRTAYLEAGEYRLLARGGLALVTVDGPALGDTTISAKVRLITPGSVGGLVFRHSDADNFYYLLISQDGLYTFGMRWNGRGEMLVPWTASPALRQGALTNTLRVEFEGIQMRAYANGQELTRIDEGALPPGTIGLVGQTTAGRQADVAFDDILAYGPLAGAEATTVPTSQPLLDQPRVELLPGDARRFGTPPKAIAFANTEFAASPQEITVTTQCGNDCWRGNEWLTVRYGSAYSIEARSTVPTTAIGVQFWGLPSDGSVRVLLDGTEIWSGSIMGSGPEVGQVFLNYLQASGLPLAEHTLRVQPVGAADAATIYFFGIGESRE